MHGSSTCVCNHRVAGAGIADEWVPLCATGVWLRCVALAGSIACIASHFSALSRRVISVVSGRITFTAGFSLVSSVSVVECFFAAWVLGHVWLHLCRRWRVRLLHQCSDTKKERGFTVVDVL